VTLALASYTMVHNATRLPTVAIPVERGPGGLPTSMQITAALGRDAVALNVAHQLEQVLWPADRRWPEDAAARDDGRAADHGHVAAGARAAGSGEDGKAAGEDRAATHTERRRHHRPRASADARKER
jgi:hypothetical protein